MKGVLLALMMCASSAANVMAAPVEPGEPVAAPKAFDAACKAGSASSKVTKDARCELLQELAGTPGSALEGVALLRVRGESEFWHVDDYYLAVKTQGQWRHFAKRALEHSLPNDDPASTLKARFMLEGMELRKAFVEGQDAIVVSFVSYLDSTFNGQRRISAVGMQAYCTVAAAPRCLVLGVSKRDVVDASTVVEEWRHQVTVKDDKLVYSLDPASKSWSEFMPTRGGASLLKPGRGGDKINALDAL